MSGVGRRLMDWDLKHVYCIRMRMRMYGDVWSIGGMTVAKKNRTTRNTCLSATFSTIN
jgi:hypothetical protein